MSRQIKFRALAETGWKVLDLTEGQRWARELLEHMAADCNVFEFKTPLLQYTGLKDRHGKEIYEGDIVRNSLEGWDCNQSHKVAMGPWGIALNGVILSFPSVHKLEVIGNVYENPELLQNSTTPLV